MPESETHPIRTLIVDDNRSLTLMLSHWLKHEGYPVQACYSGEEALDFLEREEFDVVILDWHLGGIDGPEVVRILRERKGRHAPYVIMATGDGEESAIRTAFATGVDDFVHKPLDQVMMLTRMHAARRVISLEKELREGADQAAILGLHRGGVRELSEVVATLAHDLRTPLGTLRMAASTLCARAEGMAPELLPTAERIERVSARMAETLDDVVSAFVADDGTSDMWTEFDLTAEVVRAVEMLSAAVPHGTTLCLPEGPTRLKGNPFGLRRLVLNLVSNALRHSQASRIQVGLDRDADGWMRLEIADDGKGMPASLLRHLGEALLLSSATRRQEFFVKGNGLGFTICRRIAAQHGGRILVSSGPASGTRVRVWLRADRSQPDRSQEFAPIEVEVLA